MSCENIKNFNVKSSEFYHRAYQVKEQRKDKEGLRSFFPKVLLEKDFNKTFDLKNLEDKEYNSSLAKEFLKSPSQEGKEKPLYLRERFWEPYMDRELSSEETGNCLKEQSWERYQRWDQGRVIASYWIEQTPQAFKLDSEQRIKFFKALAIVLKVISISISIMMPFALFYAPTWVPWGIGLPVTLLLGIAQFLINKRTAEQESYYQDKLPRLTKINSSLSFNPYRQLGLWDLEAERKMDKRLRSDRWNPRPTPSARELEETLGFRSGKKESSVIDCDRNPQLDVFVAESFVGVNRWMQRGGEIEQYRLQAIAKFRRKPNQILPDIEKPFKLAYGKAQLLFISPRTVRRDLEIFLRWTTAFDRLNNQINKRLEQIKQLYGENFDENLVAPWKQLKEQVDLLQNKLQEPIALLKKGVEQKQEEAGNQLIELDMNEQPLQKEEKEIVLDPKGKCATNKELSEALFQLHQNQVGRQLLSFIDCAFAFDIRLQQEIDSHPDNRMEKIRLEFERYKKGWIAREQLQPLNRQQKKKKEEALYTWLQKRENEKYWNTKCFLIPEEARFPSQVMEWLKGKSDLHTETPYSLYFRALRVCKSIESVEESLKELQESLKNQGLDEQGSQITNFINAHLIPLRDLYGLSGESSVFKFAVKKRFRSVPAVPFEKPHFSRQQPLKMRQMQEIKIDSLLRGQDEKMWRMIMASRVLLCAPFVIMAVSTIFFYLMPNVWLAWGFAIINTALGGGSFLIDRALKRMQEEKEDAKLKYLYRDRPGRQIEGLQEVCDKYDLDGTLASRTSLKQWNKLLEERESNLRKLKEEELRLEQDKLRKKYQKCIKPANDMIKKQGEEIGRKVNTYFEERAIVVDHKVRVWYAKAKIKGNQSKAYRRYQSFLKQRNELEQIRREMVQREHILANNNPQAGFKHLERDHAIALKKGYEAELKKVREKITVLKVFLKDFEQKKIRFQTWPNKIAQLAHEVEDAPETTLQERMIKDRKAKRLLGLKALLQDHVKGLYVSEEDVTLKIEEMKQGIKKLDEEAGEILKKLEEVESTIRKLERPSKNEDPLEFEDGEIEIKENIEFEKEEIVFKEEDGGPKERLINMLGQKTVDLGKVEKLYRELGVKEREELFFSLPVKLRELVGGDLLVEMCSKALLLAKKGELDIQKWWQNEETIQQFRKLFDPELKDMRWDQISSGQRLVNILFKEIDPAKRSSIVRILEEFELKLYKDDDQHELSVLITELQKLSRAGSGADLLEWAKKINKEKEKEQQFLWNQKKELFIQEFKRLDRYFQESLYRALPASLQRLFAPFYRGFTGLELRELAQNYYDAYTSIENNCPKAFWLLAPNLGVGKGKKYRYSPEKVNNNTKGFLKEWLKDNRQNLVELYDAIDKKYQNRIYAMLPEVIQKTVKPIGL